jgi:DNA-directed RNA polymerase I subunit RPA2
LSIALSEEAATSRTDMVENDKGAILSIIAGLTPFSDFNQSPRNMYECQMCKHTMGIPCLNYRYRNENKLYLLQTPQVLIFGNVKVIAHLKRQAPVCRSQTHKDYGLDRYSYGTNAIVAVISYTGYDMEGNFALFASEQMS